MLTTAQREAKSLTESIRAEVQRLRKERSEVIAGLNDIRRWIKSAVDQDQYQRLRDASGNR